MALHRGKIATQPEITLVRSFTRDDLALILEKRPGLVGTSAVKRFRDPHHRIARLYASGLRIQEVADRAGYSYQRVFTLSQDPAFQELIAKYREKVDVAYAESVDDYYELATSNMRKAEAQIAEKLEAAEEEGTLLPTRDLIAISRDAADRFGYGKRQTNLNVNADFASLLEKAIARSGKTIEGTVLQSPPRAAIPASPTSSEEPFIPIEARKSPTPQSPVWEESSRLPARTGAQQQSAPLRRRA